MQFHFNALPWRIIFAPGAVNRIGDELAELGFGRALVLSTPDQVEHATMIEQLLGNSACGTFAQAVMHVPIETVEQAMEVAERLRADCSVAIGGGSTTGLGKALALKTGLPNITIPTTYAGSEMTNIWGITEGGRKTTGRDDSVVPNLTIYDPELTLGLPASISGPSGINAMAQAVVNVTAAEPNPIISALAVDAIRALAKSLPIVVREPADIAARSDALYGACLAGGALGLGVTGLHHRICHTLGGSYNTPHADTHAIMLAHSVSFNADAAVEGTRRVADAMGVDDAARGIFDLLIQVSDKTKLTDIGIGAQDIDNIASITTETAINNPKPVSKQDVVNILEAALDGIRP